jgi:predicted nucleic acid-binding protein
MNARVQSGPSLWIDAGAGQPIQTADAWIAASARQWRCPLVTTDFRDYDAIEDPDVVPIR